MNSLRSGSYHEPDFSMALARIQRMNKDELNELLNNEDEMDDYIKSLDQVSFKFRQIEGSFELLYFDEFFLDQEFV